MRTRSAELVSQRMVDLQRLVERDALRDTETHFAAIAFERYVNAREFATICRALDALGLRLSASTKEAHFATV